MMIHEENKIHLSIPTATIVKICIAALAAAVILRLLPLLLLLLFSLIWAVSMQPVLHLFSKKIPRWLGIAIIGVISLTVIFAFSFYIFPVLISQISLMASKAPLYLEKHLQHYKYGPAIYSYLENHFRSDSPNATSWLQSFLNVGQMAMEGLSSLLLFYVFFLYLMIDGPRAYAWFLAFFKPSTQAKLEQTAHEISNVVSAYTLGQIITSLIATLYVFISLRSLGVPAAMTLAVFTGIFDALPVLGFFLSLIPAMIFAMTVSANTALAVGGLYMLYHAMENYLILPCVYRGQLRLSGLVIIFSLLVAALTAGLLGMLVVLPIVASYPIIERIWLKKYLGSQVIREHNDDKVLEPEINC